MSEARITAGVQMATSDPIGFGLWADEHLSADELFEVIHRLNEADLPE